METVKAYEVHTCPEVGASSVVDVKLTIDDALDVANALKPQGAYLGCRIDRRIADMMRGGLTYADAARAVATAAAPTIAPSAPAKAPAKATKRGAASTKPTTPKVDPKVAAQIKAQDSKRRASKNGKNAAPRVEKTSAAPAPTAAAPANDTAKEVNAEIF